MYEDSAKSKALSALVGPFIILISPSVPEHNITLLPGLIPSFSMLPGDEATSACVATCSWNSHASRSDRKCIHECSS